jgi:hypothetical protein
MPQRILNDKSTKILVLIIFALALFLRVLELPKMGGDSDTFVNTVEEFLDGRNPYVYTVESFENKDPSFAGHGYAYLPTLLYLHIPIFLVAEETHIPFYALVKIPVILADLGVGFLLMKNLRRYGNFPMLFGLAAWFFNPHYPAGMDYVHWEPIPVFFTLLALQYLGKNDILAGVSYALAFSLKTFPIILFPLFLLKSRSKLKFLLSGALLGLAVSAPFLYDLPTYIQGAFFVHGERAVQGRPFLFFISYFGKLEFIQLVPIIWYKVAAILGGWLFSVFVLLPGVNRKTESLYSRLPRPVYEKLKVLLPKLGEKYTLTTLSFVIFYLFTPVLNRTYLLWIIPFLILSAAFQFKDRPRFYYLSVTAFYLFYLWYLSIWSYGFHESIPW